MTAGLGGGLLLALASASALNWGYFAQHGAAAALPPLSLRRPLRSLRALFWTPRWLAGFVVGIAGWVLYVAALALAPLSLVQSVSAAGIGVLALLVGRGDGLARRERVGVAVSMLGLALLGASLAGHSGGGSHGRVAAVGGWIAVSALVAAVVAGPLGRMLAAGAGLGLASGVLYAAGDVGTKAALGGGTRLAFVPVLLACHGLAFASLQLAFQRGGALATAGLATLFTNALPIAAGTTIFGEGLPAGALGAARVVAFACAVAGAALLARKEPASPPAASVVAASRPVRLLTD